MEITTNSFWKEFWGKIVPPITVNYSFKNDRVIANTIKTNVLKANYNKKAFEVGCAPGKWLIFFGEELGYNVEGIEYVKEAAEITGLNIDSSSIKNRQSKIHFGDFNTFVCNEKYDLVFSLGFVEHFTDVKNVLDKHTKLIKDDGYLVIGVPNFKGINFYIQHVIDRDLIDKLLPNHNLKAMDRSLYVNYAKDNNLKMIFGNYIGGFEPGLFATDKIKNLVLHILFRILVKVLSLMLGRINHSKISGYLLFIFKKEQV